VNSAHPILVTRPEEPGRRLAAALARRGAQALWLPAFDLVAPSDADAARAALAQLARFDLAIFVSPAAVRATAGLRAGGWPAATAIGAVGRATAHAVRAHLVVGADTRIVAPAADDDGGSEALLDALDAANLAPRRVLVLRAASGRELLRERLMQRGAQVQALAVYDRRAHVPSAPEQAWLARVAAGPIDSVFSSSEAVDTVRAMLTPLAAWPAVVRGCAVASHPRIAQRLTAAGIEHVRVAALEADAILAALEDVAPRQ
jgi:uroporphyrinogen-III synthase